MRSLKITRSPSGTFVLKAKVKGPFALAPGPPTFRVKVYLVVGTDLYCTTFGGEAGGPFGTDTVRKIGAARQPFEGTCP